MGRLLDRAYARRWEITGVGIFFLILVGFGASVAHIYQQRQLLVSSSNGPCATFPTNTTSLILEKRFLSQWHWRYTFEGDSAGDAGGEVRMMCPTTQYDTALYIGDSFAAYVDGKILTTRARSNINDCQGRTLFVSETGGTWQTILNKQQIEVSYLLLSAGATDAGTVLAYVEGRHLFADDISIQAASDGHTIATMTRSAWSTTWRWYITISDAAHPAADLRVLALLAGKRSFEDSNSSSGDQMSDVCNQYFWAVSWLVLACVCLLVLLGCVMLYYYCRRSRSRPYYM